MELVFFDDVVAHEVVQDLDGQVKRCVAEVKVGAYRLDPVDHVVLKRSFD